MVALVGRVVELVVEFGKHFVGERLVVQPAVVGKPVGLVELVGSYVVELVARNNVHHKERCGKMVPVVGSSSVEHRLLGPLGIVDDGRNVRRRFLENFATLILLRHVCKTLEN